MPSYTIDTSVVGGNGTITCDSPVTSGGTSNCTISGITAGYHLPTFTNNSVDKLASVVANAYSITNVTADHAVVGTFVADPAYSVFYYPNNGTDMMLLDSHAYLSGATVTVSNNIIPFTKTGYSFSGWNTATNGSGTDYAPAATFAINVTLYAKTLHVIVTSDALTGVTTAGEVATITLQLASGATPVATDFALNSVIVIDTFYNPIAGMTASVAGVTLQ